MATFGFVVSFLNGSVAFLDFIGLSRFPPSGVFALIMCVVCCAGALYMTHLADKKEDR